MSLKNIKQTYVKVDNEEQKLMVMKDMLSTLPIEQFIVYVNSKKKSMWLKEMLENENITVLTINGSQNKIERSEILREFKDGKAKCLIATDLLSRGIDIQQLSLVINFDIQEQITYHAISIELEEVVVMIEQDLLLVLLQKVKCMLFPNCH